MADSLMIKEIFEKLNDIQYISNITPVLSVIIVAFLGWFFNYLIHKSNKKDKYLFSLAKEKFAAAQTLLTIVFNLFQLFTEMIIKNLLYWMKQQNGSTQIAYT